MNLLRSETLLLVIVASLFVGIPTLSLVGGTNTQDSTNSIQAGGLAGQEDIPLQSHVIPRLELYEPDIIVKNVDELYKALSAPRAGTRIFITENVYEIVEPLIVTVPIFLFGPDPEETKSEAVLVSRSSDNPTLSIRGTNVTIRHLTFRGGAIGLQLTKSEGSHIWNNVFEQQTVTGVLLLASSGNEISHNTFHGIGSLAVKISSGIHVSANSARNIIASNEFSEVSGLGIWLEGSGNTRNWLSKNTMKMTTTGIHDEGTNANRHDRNLITRSTTGILLLKTASTDVSNNKLTNNTVGVVVQASSKIVLFDNRFNMSRTEGIKISDSNVMVDQNEVFNGGTDGILLMNADGTVVENNFIANHEFGAGIHVVDSDNVVIRMNTLLYNMRGIWVDPSHGTRILGNRVYESSNEGMLIEASPDTRIAEGNRIIGAPIGIKLTTSTSSFIIDSFFNQTQTGILLSMNDQSRIMDNRIVGGEYGIMLDTSRLNMVHNNTVFESEIGIYLFRSTVNLLRNNTVTMAPNSGISLKSSNYNRIMGNNLVENNVGILITETLSIRNTIFRNNIQKNGIGTSMVNARANIFYHNNYLQNAIQADDTNPAANLYHNPSLRQGNFWSDYSGVDLNADGIGDTLIPHPTANYDRYPYVRRNGWVVITLTPTQLQNTINTLNLNPELQKQLIAPLDLATRQTNFNLTRLLPPDVQLIKPVFRPVLTTFPKITTRYTFPTITRKPITTVITFKPPFTLQPLIPIKPATEENTASSKAQQITKLQPITAYPILKPLVPLKFNFTTVEPAISYKTSAMQLTQMQTTWNQQVEYARANWYLDDDLVVAAFRCWSYMYEVYIGFGITISIEYSPDWDNDGIGCKIEQEIGTNSHDADTDDDGMNDGYEYYHGLDPLINDRNSDLDGDGLTNWQEFQLGTHPNRADSDYDDLDDWDEILQGTNYLDSDTDNDGLTDGWEVTHRKTVPFMGDPAVDMYNPLNPIIQVTMFGFMNMFFPEGIFDIDGDGLSALYEHSLRNWGAHPWKRDILVEVDYINGQEPTDTDGDGSEDDFADVVDAFDDYNVNLIYDIDDELPSDSYTSNSEAGDLYDDHFTSSRKGKWRYSILARTIQCSCSGYAFDIPNDMFIVARQKVYQWWDDITNPFGSDHAEAGTWMHELGHTLGLKHGGSNHGNWKLNYYSVMNYYYQVKGLYESTSRDPPSQSGTQGPLSYSDGSSITLDENNLNEAAGIGRGYGVDWNGDGDTTDTGRSYDVNGDGDFNDNIADYNDWNYLIYHLDDTLVHNSP